MPQQPTPRQSVETASSPPARDPDLRMNKVIAGAGAAATSAALGSFFGAAGTVTGAALGSVVSTVGTAVYQRSLDRTRDTVRARVRLPGGRTVDVQGEAELPAPRGSRGQARVYVSPARETSPHAWRPRRVLLLTGATLLVFLLGLLAVTAVEFAKGSTLTTGQGGTSVGRVLDAGGAAAPVPSEPGTGTEPSSETADPTPEPAPSDEPGTPDPSTPDPSTPGPASTDAPRDETGEGESGGGLLPSGVPLLPGR